MALLNVQDRWGGASEAVGTGWTATAGSILLVEVETILKKRGETIAATAIETYMERGLG